jgi:hypothetical protein
MLPRTSPVSAFILERYLSLLPAVANLQITMSSPDALSKIEQARALIEEAKGLVEEKNNADAVSILSMKDGCAIVANQ